MTGTGKPNFDASLRTALHAAVDHLDPAPDGLQRISARLTRPHPLPVAWAVAAWTALSLRAPDGVQSALVALESAVSRATERFAASERAHGRGGYRRLGWLRPLAAMATAVFVVTAGVYVAIVAPQAISPQGSGMPYSSPGVHSGKTGHVQKGPAGTSPQPGGKRHRGGSGQSNGPDTSSGCGGSRARNKPSPAPSTSTSTSASPTASTTPTPTPTPSQSSTASPTPTPTATSSTSASSNPGSAASPPAGSGNGAPGGTPTGSPSASQSTANGPAIPPVGRRDQPAQHPSSSPCAGKDKTTSPSQAQLSGVSLPLWPGLVLIVADPKGKIG
jgi:hypothetical protein